ncbi:MAG: acyltransferase [Prevotella sp.]
MPEKEWKGSTAGTPWMHRWLIRSLRVLPLRFVYAGAVVFVIPFCMLFAHKGYISIYHFFRRRLNQRPLRAFWNTYVNHCHFAQVIIDRFYVYGGGRFDFEIENYDLYRRLAAEPGGFVILSAHVGNYEVAGYTLAAKTKRFNALVYGGEAQTVMQNRSHILTQNNIRMIPIQGDMSHLFAMSNALAEGESVSIPADRIFGSPRHVECPLFGETARLPLGPFAIAAQRDVLVIAINVMKESAKKYHIYIKQLEAEGNTLRERSRNLALQYAKNLEETIKDYPTQWFNYYEFWNEN